VAKQIINGSDTKDCMYYNSPNAFLWQINDIAPPFAAPQHLCRAAVTVSARRSPYLIALVFKRAQI